MTLTAAPGVLPGDFNGNVDPADYVVWRKGLGTIYTQDHYSIWRTHFGQTAGSGAALPSAQPLSASVPEPATLMMFVVAIMAKFIRQRASVS